jgi:hypothetical protein
VSRRARSRAAAVEAKRVALVPLSALGDDKDDDCQHCRGDGMDPDCDGLLPCPVCQGEG